MPLTGPEDGGSVGGTARGGSAAPGDPRPGSVHSGRGAQRARRRVTHVLRTCTAGAAPHPRRPTPPAPSMNRSSTVVARTALSHACTVGTTRPQALGTAPLAGPSRRTAALKATRGAPRGTGPPARAPLLGRPSSGRLAVHRSSKTAPGGARDWHGWGWRARARRARGVLEPGAPEACMRRARRAPTRRASRRLSVAEPGPPAVGGSRSAERR